MPCCKCGGRHIENRDKNLCATCNKLRRAADNPVPVKAPKPIAAVSPQKAAALAAQKKAFQTLTARCCDACGRPGKLDNSHALTQKQWPAHANNPANVLKLCRDCHNLWENSKPIFREHFPEAWARKLQIIQTLEPQYYEQFKLKNP